MLFTMLLLAAWAQPSAAPQVAKLDEVIVGELVVADLKLLDPCDINLVIEEMVRKAGLLSGIENKGECFPRRPWWSPGARRRNVGDTLSGMTWREAFEHVMSPTTFRWREMSGVVVVRPQTAWNDPNNILNMSARAFVAKGTLAERILPALLNAVNPSSGAVHSRQWIWCVHR